MSSHWEKKLSKLPTIFFFYWKIYISSTYLSLNASMSTQEPIL